MTWWWDAGWCFGEIIGTIGLSLCSNIFWIGPVARDRGSNKNTCQLPWSVFVWQNWWQCRWRCCCRWPLASAAVGGRFLQVRCVMDRLLCRCENAHRVRLRRRWTRLHAWYDIICARHRWVWERQWDAPVCWLGKKYLAARERGFDHGEITRHHFRRRESCRWRWSRQWRRDWWHNSLGAGSIFPWLSGCLQIVQWQIHRWAVRSVGVTCARVEE